MPNFMTQIPVLSDLMGLPFDGNKLANQLSGLYSNSLKNSQNYMPPFMNQFQPQATQGMKNIFGQLAFQNPDKFSNAMFGLGATKIDENYNKQGQALKENMAARGFYDSSSYNNLLDVLNRGRSRDYGELANTSMIGGQNLYNNSISGLQNLGAFYGGVGNSPADYTYNWANLYGNQFDNLLGRQNDLTTTGMNLYKTMYPPRTNSNNPYLTP